MATGDEQTMRSCLPKAGYKSYDVSKGDCDQVTYDGDTNAGLLIYLKDNDFASRNRNKGFTLCYFIVCVPLSIMI